MKKEIMEKEHDKKMCYMCGNEYGQTYRWSRLILAIVIGLFIFFAGIQIGEMRGQAYGGDYYYGPSMMRHWQNIGGAMMYNQQGFNGGTTIVVPASAGSSSEATPSNPQQSAPMIPAKQ